MGASGAAAPLGSLGVLAIPGKATDVNIAFFPSRPGAVEEGEIEWSGTGADRRPDSARPLLYALLGPGATPLGLADIFLALIGPGLGSSSRVPTRERAATLLLAFNGWTTAAQLADDWIAGTLVELPIQQSQAPLNTWLVELPDPLPAVVMPDPRLFTVATNLQGAAPRQPSAARGLASVRQTVQQDLTSYVGPNASMSLATLARSLASRTLRNPYESLFRTVETLAQLPVTSGTTRPQESLVTEFLSSLGTPQLEVIASTSGGQAILRQFFRVAPAGAIRDRIGNALQQPKDTTGAFKPLESARPGRIAAEPPLCKELQSVVKTDGNNKGKIDLFAMVLGRRVAVGTDTTTPYDNADWTGPSHAGETQPETYFAAHGAAIPIPTSGVATAARARERWDARMRVVMPLTLNEGFIEGMRMADKALASIGMQQWSCHVNEEGPVILERFRARNRMLFDVFFGAAGLETAMCDSAGNPAAALATLAADNPDAYAQVHEDPADTSSPLVWARTDNGPVENYYPAHVTLRGAAPGADHAVLPASDMARRVADRGRFSFFGFEVVREPRYNAQGTIAEKGLFKIKVEKLEWPGRFRFALQTVPEWIPLQYQQAAYRFTQCQHRVRLPIGSLMAKSGNLQEIPVWCNHSHEVTELLSSEFSAAIALDMFINGPGLTPSVVREAWRRTQAAYVAEGIPASDLHEVPTAPLKPPLKREVLFRFATELAGVRRGFGFDPDTRMARAVGMHDRQPDEVYSPNSGDFKAGSKRQVKFDLSSIPSFKGWD